jgi:hypothetical protein
MKIRKGFLVFGLFLALMAGLSGSRTFAATPGFSIKAANTTLTAEGTGSTTFTLTSLNGYTGQVVVTCDDANPPAGAKLPYCGGGPLRAYTLTANETVTGTMQFYAMAVPVAASLVRRPGPWPAAGLALAGAMLIGLGWRRRARHWMMLALLAVGGLAGPAGICACGGNRNGLTSGTFQYTMYATDTSTSAQASSVFNVTVP